MVGTLFRIFFQSHAFALVSWLAFLFLALHRAFHRTSDVAIAGVILYLSSASLIISQSRSFLGRTVRLPPWRWILYAVVGKQLSGNAPDLYCSCSASRCNRSFLSLLWSRATTAQMFSPNVSQPPVRARHFQPQNQLRPLLDAIAQHPWLGSGFGRTVTYRSTDPRVLADHPAGAYTTTAFEWGYLDIALKIGLLGPGVRGVDCALIYGLLKKKPAAEWGKISAGFAFGLLGVAVTKRIFSILNHPWHWLGHGLRRDFQSGSKQPAAPVKRGGN